MNCPNKICAQEIPDDSCFCDQCGVQLLRCDKCSFVSTSKFCGKCGGSMAAIEPPASQAPSAPLPAPATEPSVATSAAPTPAVSAATVIVALPAEKIFLCHTEGWTMEIADGDILGRTKGPHAAQLAGFPVISSSHAKITQTNNQWFITDLKSTNKTYINGTKLEPDIPVKIKQNDVVILANVTFTVREI